MGFILLIFAQITLSKSCFPVIYDNICPHCDIENVKSTEENLKNLNKNEITCFLQGFNDSCKYNIEYSEYSNKVLFEVLQAYPKDFFSILSNNQQINKKYIYSEIANPIIDYDFGKIIDQIIAINLKSKTKNEVIKQLRVALHKYNY